MRGRKFNSEQAQADRASARRKRAVWGLARTLLVLGVMVALGVWIALRSRPPQVLEVVPATALYDDDRAVKATDVFHPEDTFFVSLKLSGYRPDMKLLARWKYEGRQIAETPLNTGNAGAGYAGSTLTNGNPPWSVGGYTVEIMYGDEVLGSAAFRVEP